MRFTSSNVSFKTCVSLLIFCSNNLFISVSGVLNYPTIIVLLSISPFMSVSVCLMYWGAHMLGASVQFSSVAQSCPTLCNPMNRKHARPPWPSPTPRVYPNSCPLSQWYHLTISSSVVPFSSCLQSSPTSGSFQMSQIFASGGQNIGVSAPTSVFPMNTQDWSPLEWTGWISLQSKGPSRVFSNTTAQKHQFFGAQLSL